MLIAVIKIYEILKAETDTDSGTFLFNKEEYFVKCKSE